MELQIKSDGDLKLQNIFRNWDIIRYSARTVRAVAKSMHVRGARKACVWCADVVRLTFL